MGHAAVANTVAAHLNYQPALWSPRSLQHLTELSSAFVVQHGRALALIVWCWVDEEAEVDEESSDEE